MTRPTRDRTTPPSTQPADARNGSDQQDRAHPTPSRSAAVKAVVPAVATRAGGLGAVTYAVLALPLWPLMTLIIGLLVVVVLLVVLLAIPAGWSACSGADPARRADAFKVLEILIPWRQQKSREATDPE